MASGRKRGRPIKQKPNKEHQESPNDNKNEYEKMRQERIKENLARMKQMGILELSKKLSGESRKASPSKKSRGCVRKIQALPDSTRRSSRLNTMTRVNYAEGAHSPKKAGRAARVTEIHLQQGSEPEIYTAEHEKLLGDCKTKWALYVDGYDKNGKRIYDPVEGKGCHQCRQKTLGRRTRCSSCKTGQGQFCGDCLFTRYSDIMLENCSAHNVKRLGFKSVAHYLIQSRFAQTIQEGPTKEDPDSQNGLLPTTNGESEPTYGISNSQSDGNEEIEEDSDLGSMNGGTYNQDGNIEDYDTVNNNERK
uniref:Zinc-finger domain-containing protein n=1 Tax=Daucus carota subsp. sativus TaxID=79200 RepID=A0A175YDZ6_DAUCS